MDVKKIYRRPSWVGLGNLVLQLGRNYGIHPYISENVLENEFGTCVKLDYFQVVKDDPAYEQTCYPFILCEESLKNYRIILPSMLSPSSYMRGIINDNIHLLKDVTAGVNIRRGSYSSDTLQYEDGGKAEHYFCSDEGVDKFIEIIRAEPGKVYVTSDSPSTKNKLKEIFGDKITMNETEYVHTSDEDWSGRKTIKNMQDVYLVWFLLSMCPKIYITSGKPNSGLTGLSTFGLTAALYGNKPNIDVFNT
jgi:hypothetical protein